MLTKKVSSLFWLYIGLVFNQNPPVQESESRKGWKFLCLILNTRTLWGAYCSTLNIGLLWHWVSLLEHSNWKIAYMSVPFSCNFFWGLSLALRSHDQIPALYWLPPPPSRNLFKFVLVLLSASLERVGVSRMQDLF